MFIVLNWKMNPNTLPEARKIFEASKKAARKGFTTIVAPPALFLQPLAASYRGRAIAFASQTIHTEGAGAFTGDISAKGAKSAGALYTLIGHAERRKAGETDEDVRKKVLQALSAGLSPIICIGETARDSSGVHFEVIKRQLVSALADVEPPHNKKIIIAYEPVWAIGSEKPMGAFEMHEMSLFIRKLLFEKYGKGVQAVPILYGGAILDEKHAVLMVKESEVDGFLLGRMSLDIEKLTTLFSALVKVR